MGWFPAGKDDTGAWRLDIVALLAVTGESFVIEHSQAITSSLMSMLPRIMPAPHALLRPLRPASLPSEIARVVGVYSGTVLDTVGFFANLIHPLDSLPSFGFRVIQIRHRQPFDQSLPTSAVLATRGDGMQREEASGAKTSGFDPESGEQPAQPSLVRRQTVRQRASTLVSNGPIVINPMVRPAVRTSSLSPLNILSFISFLMTLGLIAAAVVWNDGTALTAICLISLASSVICYAAFWQPIILTRRSSDVPRGDVVIRTREGGFILVRCTENIARELYSGIQECSYHVSGIKYRLLMILGATMIMPSVVLMGNCTFNMQLLIGSCYMMLNVAYWSLGTLPLYRFWDLSSYEWQDVTPEDSRNAERFDHTGGYSQFDSSPSFTRTLWYAIRETQLISWVSRSGTTPMTPQWRKWLAEAEHQARIGNRNWPAVKRKDEIMQQRPDDE